METEWNKGDIAICIKDDAYDWQIKIGITTTPPVRMNCEYIVIKKHECPNCNSVHIDIGLASASHRIYKSNVHQNCKCGEVIPCKEVHWVNAGRFKKKIVKKKSDIPFLEDEEP